MIRRRQKKYTVKQQIEILEYIDELLASGYSMKQTLCFIETLVEDRKMLLNIAHVFEAGGEFSEILALLDYPILIQTLIRFGESSGLLRASIHRSVDYLKANQSLRALIVKQVQYPIVILSATLLFVVGFQFFLFPHIQSIQEMIGGGEKSATAQTVMALLVVIPYVIFIFISVFFVAGLSFFILYRRKDARWFTGLMCVPVIRRIIQIWNQVQFSMFTRIFFEQGYGVRRLFEEMQKEEYPVHMTYQAKKVYGYLQKGLSYSDALLHSRFYTDDYIQVIQRGSMSQTLNVDLLFYERYGQKRFTKQLTHVIRIILPILYAHVGLLIVLSYLSFLLPMLDILSTL